jgi:hypothetical protein
MVSKEPVLKMASVSELNRVFGAALSPAGSQGMAARML